MANVAVVLVTRHHEALFLRRGPTAPWKSGWWNLPGGIIEPGEPAEVAAYRELQEETGLDDVALVRLGHYHTDEDVIWAYKAEAPEGWEPLLCHESDAAMWCPPQEAPMHLVDPIPAILASWVPY